MGKGPRIINSLEQVSIKVDPAGIKRIKENNLKKAVVLITDGRSNNAMLTRKIKNNLIDKGVLVKAVQIGETRKEDNNMFAYVWGDDGMPCKDVSRLVIIIEKLLEELLEDL